MAGWWDTAGPLVGVVLGAQLTMMNERRRERRQGRIKALRIASIVQGMSDVGPDGFTRTDMIELRIALAEADAPPRVFSALYAGITECARYFGLSGYPAAADKATGEEKSAAYAAVQTIDRRLTSVLDVELVHPWGRYPFRWSLMGHLKEATERLRTINDRYYDRSDRIEASERPPARDQEQPSTSGDH